MPLSVTPDLIYGAYLLGWADMTFMLSKDLPCKKRHTACISQLRNMYLTFWGDARIRRVAKNMSQIEKSKKDHKFSGCEFPDMLSPFWWHIYRPSVFPVMLENIQKAVHWGSHPKTKICIFVMSAITSTKMATSVLQHCPTEHPSFTVSSVNNQTSGEVKHRIWRYWVLQMPFEACCLQCEQSHATAV